MYRCSVFPITIDVLAHLADEIGYLLPQWRCMRYGFILIRQKHSPISKIACATVYVDNGSVLKLA